MSRSILPLLLTQCVSGSGIYALYAILVICSAVAYSRAASKETCITTIFYRLLGEEKAGGKPFRLRKIFAFILFGIVLFSLTISLFQLLDVRPLETNYSRRLGAKLPGNNHGARQRVLDKVYAPPLSDTLKQIRTKMSCSGSHAKHRVCLFRHLIFDTYANAWLFLLLPTDPPYAFSFDKDGPAYSFPSMKHKQNGWVRLNARGHGSRSWSPEVKRHIGNIEDSSFASGAHFLFAGYGDHNFGHFVADNCWPLFAVSTNFGYNLSDVQVVLTESCIHGGPCEKFWFEYFPQGWSKPPKNLNEFRDAGTRYIIFDTMIVGSGTYGMSAGFDLRHIDRGQFTNLKGNGYLFWLHRKHVLSRLGINPDTVPNRQQILLINKDMKLTRSILNFKELHAKVSSSYSSYDVLVISEIEKLSLYEQASIFSQTTVVVAPYGGISFNLFLLPVGSTAILLDGGPQFDWPGGNHQESGLFWNHFNYFNKLHYVRDDVTQYTRGKGSERYLIRWTKFKLLLDQALFMWDNRF